MVIGFAFSGLFPLQRESALRAGRVNQASSRSEALTLSAVASTGTHAPSRPVRISLVSSTCTRCCDPGTFRSHVCDSCLFYFAFMYENCVDYDGILNFLLSYFCRQFLPKSQYTAYSNLIAAFPKPESSVCTELLLIEASEGWQSLMWNRL